MAAVHSAPVHVSVHGDAGGLTVRFAYEQIIFKAARRVTDVHAEVRLQAAEGGDGVGCCMLALSPWGVCAPADFFFHSLVKLTRFFFICA